MDSSISNALQSGAVLVKLDLWRLHTEHITKVYVKGKKSPGCSTYHPMLMNWAMAFLAHTSYGTYNKVGKIMCLLHVSTVYKNTAKLIITKKDKAYCLLMNTIQSISNHAHWENWTCARFGQHKLRKRA
jgi:hypothetical protein